MARYEEIARDLRELIDRGEWQPNDRLPSTRVLAGDYQADVATAKRAVRTLASWGYVRIRDRSGTTVLDRTVPKTPLSIGQSIGYHPVWGYLYNPAAGDWKPLGTPDRAWVELDHEVADLLDVDPGASVLARHRVVGPPSGPAQTTTTYFSRELGDRFDVDDTGPGGWMQQVEQTPDVVAHGMGLGPLRWRCAVSARKANEREARDLDLDRESAVLVLAFVITSRRGVRPLAVDVMTFDATRFRVEYPVPRSAAARWPVTPATGQNAPLPECD